jgi:hypothetical protein
MERSERHGARPKARLKAPDPSSRQSKPLEYAPSSKEELLRKAELYRKQRDYINAMINIVRAEQADGNEMSDIRISCFKNHLIENLNARALSDERAAEQGGGLDGSLEYMVFFTDGELVYPAFNVPVDFEVCSGDAQVRERDYTDSGGIARCDVFRVKRFEDGKIIIQASVNLDIGEQVFTIEKLTRDFTLYPRSLRDETISCVILERNIHELEQDSASGKRIERFFVQNNFSVKPGLTVTDEAFFFRARDGDEPSLALYGKVLHTGQLAFVHIESSPSSKVSEGFFFARATVTLTMVDVSTGDLVFEAVAADIRGAGNTEKKAGSRAIMEATDMLIEQLQGHVSEFH